MLRNFTVLNQTTIQHKLKAIANIFTTENYTILEAIKLANSLRADYVLTISDSLKVLTTNSTQKPVAQLCNRPKHWSWINLQTQEHRIYVDVFPHWNKKKRDDQQNDRFIKHRFNLHKINYNNMLKYAYNNTIEYREHIILWWHIYRHI